MGQAKTSLIDLGALGFGLLFLFDALLAMSDPVAGLSDFGFLSAQTLATVLCYALAAVFFKRLDGIIGDRRVPVAGAVIGTVGVGSILAFQVTGFVSAALVVMALVLACLFQCLLFLCYYRVFSTKPLAEVALSLALCHVLSGAVLFVVVLSGVRLVAVVLALLVPAAVAFLFRRYTRTGAGQLGCCFEDDSHRASLHGSVQGHGHTESVATPTSAAPAAAAQGSNDPWRLKLPLRPLLLLAVTVTVKCVFANPLLNERVAADFFGVVAISVAVFLIVLTGRPAIRFKLLYDISMFALMIGLFFSALDAVAVSGFMGMDALAGFFANAGYVTFSIFLVTLLCNACQRYSVSTVLMFGLMGIVESVFFALGSKAGSVVAIQEPLLRVLIAFFCALVVVSCFVLLLTDRDYRTSWGTSLEKDDRPSIAEYYYTLSETCSALAQQHGLTRREEEVLVLLAQRKTIPDVEAELFISNSTAKAHCKSIYRKLGVHKREELLRMVGHPSIDEAQKSKK